MTAPSSTAADWLMLVSRVSIFERWVAMSLAAEQDARRLPPLPLGAKSCPGP